MHDFKSGWFVIYTKPNHERKIAEQLEKMDASPFLPTVKKLRVWSDRRKYIDMPLFPSYVFVNLTNIETYFESLGLKGVFYFVRDGENLRCRRWNLENERWNFPVRRENRCNRCVNLHNWSVDWQNRCVNLQNRSADLQNGFENLYYQRENRRNRCVDLHNRSADLQNDGENLEALLVALIIKLWLKVKVKLMVI